MAEIKSLAITGSSKKASKRTARVIMTDEARVLKLLREERGFSMRALGAAMGKSDSYISQVENGRMDIPTAEALDHYLSAIGGITAKSFYEKVRRFRLDRGPTERDELIEIAKRVNDVQLRNILVLAKTILATEPNLIR